MSRERRFEQKQNARIRRFKRIWNDLSPWEIKNIESPSYLSWSTWDRNRLRDHWRKHACGVNYSAVPGWWNRMYHTQPRRIEANRLCHFIVRGQDPETVLWPARKRPIHYYW